MTIFDLPIAPFPSAQARRDWETRIRRECIRDGRASRALGIAIAACPPFCDPDMAIDWKNGWRWEDEERAAKRNQIKEDRS
jgi:hypothetical protein